VGQRRSVRQLRPARESPAHHRVFSGRSHTRHATEADARHYARRILPTCNLAFLRSVLAMPVIVWPEEPARERFPGRRTRMTCEARSCVTVKALNGTSHEPRPDVQRAFQHRYSSAEGVTECADAHLVGARHTAAGRVSLPAANYSGSAAASAGPPLQSESSWWSRQPDSDGSRRAASSWPTS